MDFLQLLNEYWNVLSVLVMLLTGFVLWHMSQRFVSKKEFESAIANLNTTITNLPNTAALHRLELGLEELRGLQRESAAQLKGQAAALERLNNNFDRLAIKREAI